MNHNLSTSHLHLRDILRQMIDTQQNTPPVGLIAQASALALPNRIAAFIAEE